MTMMGWCDEYLHAGRRFCFLLSDVWLDQSQAVSIGPMLVSKHAIGVCSMGLL
jgi:hypothetical protein